MRQIYTPPWLQEIREYWLQLCQRGEKTACNKPAPDNAPDADSQPNTPPSNRASPDEDTHVSLPPICSDESDASS